MRRPASTPDLPPVPAPVSSAGAEHGLQGEAPKGIHPVVWMSIGVAAFAAVFLIADLFGLIDVGKPPSAASLSGHAAESPASTPTLPSTDLGRGGDRSRPSNSTAVSKSRENWWDRGAIVEDAVTRSKTSNETAANPSVPLSLRDERMERSVWDDEPTGGTPLVAGASNTSLDAAKADLISKAERSVVAIRSSVSGGTKQGSGFVVDTSGIIATNYHVIEGARWVEVAFPGGESFSAIGWLSISPGKDLALIKCQLPIDSHSAALASKLPDRTERVFALGSPLGLEGTVTDGIVSAIRSGAIVGYDKDAVMIQMTAPISPGNSGGPLINRAGQVVGVNSLSRLGGQNLNFAVSSQHVADLLKAAAKVGQPWSKLPSPRPDPVAIANAERERQKRKEGERVRTGVAAVATAIKESQQQQIENSTRQGELDRIVVRVGQLEGAISVIEAEGTALTQNRGQVMATAAGVFQRGRQVEDQIANLQGQLQQCWMLLNAAIINQLDDRVALRRAQMAEIEAQLSNLGQLHSDLETQIASLDREARDLLGQINYKTVQRNQLIAEREALRRRYDEIRGN